jgi:hypothetical protein
MLILSLFGRPTEWWHTQGDPDQFVQVQQADPDWFVQDNDVNRWW